MIKIKEKTKNSKSQVLRPWQDMSRKIKKQEPKPEIIDTILKKIEKKNIYKKKIITKKESKEYTDLMDHIINRD